MQGFGEHRRAGDPCCSTSVPLQCEGHALGWMPRYTPTSV
jgi:hypothetical protein